MQERYFPIGIQSLEEALKQIDDKCYAIQYEAGDKKIVKIGVNFEKDRRTIARWVVE